MDSRHYNHDRLRRLREKTGLSQEFVASNVLEGGRRLIVRAEAGECLTYENLVELASFYKVPIKSLLYARPKKFEPASAMA